ncbi:hypothetical protein CcCBS67573_g09358 [Chytriomyces confervae]|uniref:Uncharacterized protein n=1 Tax=Chytriomyces confervae TaxID=246404 RepID=A0A507DX68_9FUNG|nr:hypothetical protein CcCBS67573_g09358 [Chytriomyces confervae]
MQADITAVKDTQLSIFYTRLRDLPLELVVQIFAWIPARAVLKFRLLSKAIIECLLTNQFAAAELAVWTALVALRISTNPISTAIPSAIWSLGTLVGLEMSGCNMVGSLAEPSIMDGATRRFGAATQLKSSKNTMQLAQLILEKQPNTRGFLCGDEAEEFGTLHNLPQEPQEYFKTERRWRQHLEGLELLDKRPQVSEDFVVGPKGTVGAVALDVQGNLAAATSTGGKTNKMSSKLGDTPLIGCGTYAENGLVACSGTGDGVSQ